MRRLLSVLLSFVVLSGGAGSVMASDSSLCEGRLNTAQFTHTSMLVGGTLLVGGLVTAGFYSGGSGSWPHALLSATGTTVLVASHSILGPSFVADFCGKSPNYTGTALGALSGLILISLGAKVVLSEGRNLELIPVALVGGYLAMLGGGIAGYNIQEDMKHQSVGVALSDQNPMVVWQGHF